MALTSAHFLDTQAVAIEGMWVDDATDKHSRTYTDPSNATLFGRAAIQGSNPDEFQVPSGSAGVFIGITTHTYSVAAGDVPLATEGIPATQPAVIMTKGRMWVVVEEAIVLTDLVFYRHATPGAAPEALGRFRKDADVAAATQVVNARWLTTGAAGALVQLELFHVGA